MSDVSAMGGASLRLEPNHSMLATRRWDSYFGELLQSAIDETSDIRAVVELDTSSRPVAPEDFIGASGLEGITLYLLGMASREAVRLADRMFDHIVDWITRRGKSSAEEVSVRIYGPDGVLLKSVLVDPDGNSRDWP